MTPGGTYSFIIEIDTTDNNIALYWANVANKPLINAWKDVATVATLQSDTWTGTDAIGMGEINANVAGSVGGDFTGTFSSRPWSLFSPCPMTLI